tara:strand:- start:52 stop:9615 length:9564 start_codon:yes stop_codon:yes gene_type:complete
MKKLLLLVSIFTFIGGVALAQTVTSISPSLNSDDVSVTSNITINFSEAMDNGTITSSTVIVSGSQRGIYSGTFSYGSNSATFNPDESFFAGEIITVIVTDGVENASNTPITSPYRTMFTAQASGDGEFSSSDEYTVHGSSFADWSITADINEDGYVDIITLVPSQNQMSVFTNDGNGSFSGPTNYTTANSFQVEAKDVNQDGAVDLVTSNNNAFMMSVFINNGSGSGTFASKVDYANGSSWNGKALTTGDIDNDGDEDVLIDIIIGGAVDSIQVFLNDGDGTYTVADGISTTDGYEQIKLWDIDGDEDLDFVGLSPGLGQLVTYRNDGTGSFSIHTTSTVTSSSYQFTLANFKSSSADIEAMTADQADDEVTYLGDGIPWAFGATPSTIMVGDTPVGIASGDLDGDGHIDVVVSNAVDMNLSIIMNDGTPSFTVSEYSTGSTYANFISLADVDNDGDLDIVMANQDGTLSVADNFEGTQVTSITPANSSTDIASNGNITVKFNDAMKESTLNSTNVTVVGNTAGTISATYTYNSGDSTLSIDPSSDFILGDEITVTVTTNVTNEGDQPIASSAASTFTVEGVNIQSTSPSANAVEVAANSDIDITFNDNMDNTTLTTSNILVFGSLSGKVAGSISISGNTATFDPTADFLDGEEVSVVVTTNVENSSNVAIEGPRVFDFNVDGSGEYITKDDTLKSVGQDPYDVLIIDVDLDGNLDLVTNDATDNTVSILLNDGTGGYSTASTLATGTFPTSVTSGDFDNANGMDFVVTNFTDNDIRVYLNNGSGTFSTADYAASTGTIDAAVGDFDGDGYLDIAAVNRNGLNATVFINDQDGTFTSSGNIGSIGSNVDRIYAADLDNDKDIDLVITGSDAAVHIVLNDGDGTFTSGSAIAGQYRGVEFIDIDGDGFVDAVLTSRINDQVSVRINDGTGGFGAATDYAMTDPEDVSAFDYDNDGDMDFAVVKFTDQEVQILLNDGTGSLSTGQTYDVGTWPEQVAIADLDEDGQLDFVTPNRGGDNISINYGLEFVEVTAVSPATNSQGISATANITATFNTDMDSGTFTSSTVLVHGSFTGLIPGVFSYDGPSKTMTFNPDNSFKPGEEITVTVTSGVENSNGNSLTMPETFSFIAEASGSGYFSYALESSVFPNQVSSLYGADLDGDGDQDQVGVYNNYFSVRFNDGSGTYGFGTATDYSMSGGGGHIIPADLDNDGDIDVLAMRANSKYLVFMENNGSGAFSRNDSIATNQVVVGGRWGIGDFNNDGIIDVAMVDYTGSAYAIYIYTNDGAMNFTSYYQSSDLAENSYVDITDLNNDGHLDFVLSDRYESFATILNNGDGTLGSETTISAPSGSNTRAIAADLNGDGYQDIIVSNAYADDGSSFSIYLNQGNGTFTSSSNTLMSFDGFWVKAADMDGDDDLDVILGRSNALIIGYNDGSGTIDEIISYSISGSNSGAAVFDYDGDGDLDILNPNFPNVSYLTNTSPTTPSSAVTSLSFSNVFGTEVTTNWSNGDGTGRLVVAKEGSAVDATPTDDEFYTAGDFGSGTELGTGNYVVYAGTGSSADITGLTPDSTYHFAVYEYNKGSTAIKYLTSGPATGNTTTKLYPTTASTVSIDDDQGTLLELSWSGGDGAKQLVAIREGSAITWEPSDSTTYSANSSFTSAADLGDGTKVVSNDNSGSVTVTDLSLSMTYYITVFEYNGDAGFETYLTSQTGTASTTTQSFEGVAFDSEAGFAYRFDGGDILDSYAELYTDGNVLIDDAFTTEIWIKPDSLGIQQYFLSWYEEQLVLGVNSSNQLFGFHSQQGSGGSQVTVTGTTTLTKGEWYHVALTGESGGNLTLFVNGVEEASSAITDVSGDDDYDDYWYLGSEYAENNYFYGTVDELRIWSAVRTESEIRSFMHRTYAGLTNDLAAYWQFNEGTGDSDDELNSYTADFYDEYGWVLSTAPVAAGTLNQANGVQSGTLSLGNVSINLTNGFDNTVDVYAYELEALTYPPSGYLSTFGNKYFIISVFGDPGTFSANLTLDYGSGNIPPSYDSTPDSLKLLSQGSGGNLNWTSLGGADAVSSTAGTATWNGITSFSQFAAVDTGNVGVTFTKTNYADGSLEANQDRIAYDVWITRGDDQGIYNASTETSFSRNTSPDGTFWAFGTTEDVGSLSFDNWKDAINSNPPASLGKDMVMYLPDHEEYVDIKFLAWTSNGNGGGFSYIRSVVNIPDPSPITFDSTAGYALDFDGTDDYMYYDRVDPNTEESDDLPDPMTIEMWVNPDTLGNQMVLAASYGTAYQIGINSDNNFYAWFRDADDLSRDSLYSTTSLTAGQWNHLAISVGTVADGESSEVVAKMYVNGTREDTVAYSLYRAGSDRYQFGSSRYLDNGSYYYFDGKMDEVRIWSEARTDSAIRAGMFTSNLNATKLEIESYWQMNEGSGNTVEDLANGQDLTLDQDGASFQPAWVTSYVPIGGGTPQITTNFQTGTATIGNASLSMVDGFDNPVDIQVTEVSGNPNQFPTGFTSGLGGKYFVINLFGTPGTFSASLTLEYGAGVVTATQQSNPGQLKLYKRGSNSTGAWIEVASASSANSATGVVTWNGITSFSQFMAVADEPTFNIQIADGTEIVSYNDSTYTFADSLFDLEDGFADSVLTINSKSTLTGTLYLDQNSNDAYDSGTDSLLTANKELQYTPSGSIKLRYNSSTSGLETAVIKLQFDSEADSVSLDFFTVEGDPILSGNADENGWYLLSNPFTTTIGELLSNVWTQGAVNSNAPSGDATLYTFSQDSSKYVATTTDVDTTKLSAGQGLLVYLYEDDDLGDGQSDIDGGWPKTLTNYGSPFGTDISITTKNVNHDGVEGTSGSEGFALLGNPYGWSLSADSVISTLKREDPLANSYVYRWNAVEKTYQILSTGSINPYESVFVRVITSGTTADLSFDYDDGVGVLAKTQTPKMFELNLVHTESGISSKLYLRNGSSASEDIDPYDGYYLGSYANKFANLYSLVGDQPLSINNIPLGFNGEIEIPLHLDATISGEFELDWNPELLPSEWTVTLVNNSTGESISMNDASSYSLDLESKRKAVLNSPTHFYTFDFDKNKKMKNNSVLTLKLVSSLSVGTENELGIPNEVELYQNYPNPFNPTSIIRFGVPEQSKVKLEVFDILGRKVATLLNNEVKPAGRYNLTFFGDNLASGIYLYRLSVGNKVIVKKMTLIK